MKYLKILVFGLMTLMPLQAFACRDPQHETQTLLTALPPEAIEERSIVAKVEIKERKKPSDQRAHLFFANVKKSIKGGLKVNQKLTILVPNTSCTRDAGYFTLGDYYVAGKVNDDGLFVGEWTGLDKQLYWNVKQ